MKLSISVIICAHNPRQEYLQRVLNALEAQSLPLDFWEILLVDNASSKSLATEFNLSWHPQARCIREETLGLTTARLRGIREAAAELAVFVDDDNILDSDYLETALQISKEYLNIGAWGGQIVPEFEQQPPNWAKPYMSYLAIREFNRDSWSNFPFVNESTPCGAGLCVRRVVAEQYAELVQSNPKRKILGREGNLLTSCEDSDLALVACDIGLGMGQFQALKLTHLIPSSRLQEEYLLRLIEGMSYSHVLLDSFRGKYPEKSKNSWKSQFLKYYRRLRKDPTKRKFDDAVQRGFILALKQLSVQ